MDEKQPVTVAMALRPGKLCGNGPVLRLNLQRAYDLEHIRQELASQIEKIPTPQAA